MWGNLDHISFIVGAIRRAFLRLAEVVFVGEILGAIRVFPGFHEAFFNENVVFWCLIFVVVSLTLDLLEIVTRPPPEGSACNLIEPELPLEDHP